MADFSIGDKLRVTLFGQSHGPAIGCVMDGLPAGLAIDWERVRADGVDFAILRVGFRGNTVGGLKPDERFAENYVAARKAGLRVGVYFYSQAVSEAEAAEEAAYVLELLDGVPLELPVFFDWEEVADGRTGGKATSEVGGWARRL